MSSPGKKNRTQHATQPNTQPNMPEAERGYQPDGTQVWSIAKFLIALTVGVAASMGVVALLSAFFELDQPVRAMNEPPQPRLQAAPEVDFHEYRASENKELQTYGWLDRDQGRVRIPIDRAMQLLIEENKSDEANETTPEKKGGGQQ